MRVVVTIPRVIQERILQRLRERTDHVLEVDAKMRCGTDEWEFFVGSSEAAEQRPGAGAARAPFSLFPAFMRATGWQFWSGFQKPARPGPLIQVCLVEGGGFCGAFVDAGGVGPISDLRLPGSGMEC
jgi:hypothetical protein